MFRPALCGFGAQSRHAGRHACRGSSRSTAALTLALRASTMETKACPRRAFATTAFNIRASGPSAPEQTLFIVGLNKGKFFGQDGAEEGLKLLERVAEHNPDYHLLFGLNEKAFSELEEAHKVQSGRLTPSRDLVLVEHGEVVPIMQAGVVDKRPRRAIGRAVRTSQSWVALWLWRNPREAVKLYWLYWRRKDYKDAAAFKFWSEQMPVCSKRYFGDLAEIITVRTVEHLIAERRNGRRGTTVLTVSNEVFALVAERCGHYLGQDPAEKLADPDFSEDLKAKAAEACRDIPDVSPFLVLIYLGFPLLVVHQVFLICEYFYTSGGQPSMASGQEFDLVTGNRD